MPDNRLKLARATEREYNGRRSESKISAQTHKRIVGIRREHTAAAPRKLSATEVAWKQFRDGLGDISIPAFGDHNARNGKDRK